MFTIGLQPATGQEIVAESSFLTPFIFWMPRLHLPLGKQFPHPALGAQPFAAWRLSGPSPSPYHDIDRTGIADRTPKRQIPELPIGMRPSGQGGDVEHPCVIAPPTHPLAPWSLAQSVADAASVVRGVGGSMHRR